MEVDCRPGVERAQLRFTARRERRRPDPRLSETLRTARRDAFGSQLGIFRSQLNVLRVLLNVTRTRLERDPGALESDVTALDYLDQAMRSAVEPYERLRELEERAGQAGLDVELMWENSFMQIAEGLATTVVEQGELFPRILGEGALENLRFLVAMGANENTDGRRRVDIMEISEQIQRLENSLEGRLGAVDEEELNPAALDGVDFADGPTMTTAGDAPFSGDNSVDDAPLDEATMNELMATSVDDDPLTEAEQNMILAILNQPETPPWSGEIDSPMSETNEPPISSSAEAITPPSPATPGTSATSATPLSGTSGIDEEMRRARDRRWEELRRRLSRHTRTEDQEGRMTEE
jgi:hypothetical protein